jgi:hypothetical protein
MIVIQPIAHIVLTFNILSGIDIAGLLGNKSFRLIIYSSFEAGPSPARERREVIVMSSVAVLFIFLCGLARDACF